MSRSIPLVTLAAHLPWSGNPPFLWRDLEVLNRWTCESVSEIACNTPLRAGSTIGKIDEPLKLCVVYNGVEVFQEEMIFDRQAIKALKTRQRTRTSESGVFRVVYYSAEKELPRIIQIVLRLTAPRLVGLITDMQLESATTDLKAAQAWVAQCETWIAELQQKKTALGQ